METIQDTPTLAVISESATHIAFVNGNTYKREEVVRAVNSHEELKKIEARYEALIQVLSQYGASDWVTGLKFQAEAISRAESPR